MVTRRPREILRSMSRLYPTAWQQYNQARRDQGQSLPDWPEWCYCPMAMAYAIVSNGAPIDVLPANPSHIAILAALASWRMSQVVYQFDPDLADNLISTKMDKLPAAIYRLPQWGMYIDLSTLDAIPLAGFFAHLEHDINDGRAELRILVDPGEDHLALVAFPIHLDRGSLVDAIGAAMQEARRQAVNHGRSKLLNLMNFDFRLIADQVAPLVSLLLYLCSEEPDTDKPLPTNPRPQKVRRGYRIFPASEPQAINIGYRIGAAIRKARQSRRETMTAGTQEKRKSPVPHIRSAHWHTYWTGSGDRRTPVLHWIPPIMVSIDDPEKIPATIRKVAN